MRYNMEMEAVESPERNLSTDDLVAFISYNGNKWA